MCSCRCVPATRRVTPVSLLALVVARARVRRTVPATRASPCLRSGRSGRSAASRTPRTSRRCPAAGLLIVSEMRGRDGAGGALVALVPPLTAPRPLWPTGDPAQDVGTGPPAGDPACTAPPPRGSLLPARDRVGSDTRTRARARRRRRARSARGGRALRSGGNRQRGPARLAWLRAAAARRGGQRRRAHTRRRRRRVELPADHERTARRVPHDSLRPRAADGRRHRVARGRGLASRARHLGRRRERRRGLARRADALLRGDRSGARRPRALAGLPAGRAPGFAHTGGHPDNLSWSSRKTLLAGVHTEGPSSRLPRRPSMPERVVHRRDRPGDTGHDRAPPPRRSSSSAPSPRRRSSMAASTSERSSTIASVCGALPNDGRSCRSLRRRWPGCRRGAAVVWQRRP